MRIFVIILMIVIAPGGCTSTIEKEKKGVEWVDVFIGTFNSRWMLGPYASVPFGMIQLGPDNQWDVCMSGYDYAINSVSGISHIHAWTMSGLRTWDFSKWKVGLPWIRWSISGARSLTGSPFTWMKSTTPGVHS